MFQLVLPFDHVFGFTQVTTSTELNLELIQQIFGNLQIKKPNQTMGGYLTHYFN